MVTSVKYARIFEVQSLNCVMLPPHLGQDLPSNDDDLNRLKRGMKSPTDQGSLPFFLPF